MNMVSMALEPEKKEEGKSDSCCCSAPCCCEEDKPRFPWGLQLELKNEQLKALGMVDLPKVGTSLTIQAVVKVTRCGEEECQGEEPERSVSLQITDLGFEMPQQLRKPVNMAETAAALYNKGA